MYAGCMFQVIVTDLDGTLLDSSRKVGSVTASTLREVEAMGLHFVLATARHYIDACHFRDAMQIHPHMITLNGARAHLSDGTRLFAQDLDPAIAMALMSGPLTRHVLVGAFVDEGWLLNRPCPELEAHALTSGLFPAVRDLAFHDGTGVALLGYIGTTEDIGRLRAEILERFAGKVRLSSSTDTTLEVTAQTASKGGALSAILRRLGVPASACVAFGDGDNDIDMLSLAGRPFAMSGSSPALLAALPGVPSAGSNDQSGVAHTLRELFGLPR
jgi:Cof subfamily protein (haloacid dehalogenase superfamily)